MRAQVFIAHSTQDAAWRHRLVTMLSPLDRFGLSCWDETKIEPGQHRQKEISAALAAANVVVLLVSSDFLAFNQVFQQELSAILLAPTAQQRLRILWVAVKPCLWEQSALAPYQPANDPNKPLAGMSHTDADAALVAICRHIHAAVDASLAISASREHPAKGGNSLSFEEASTASSATDFRAACAFIVAGTRRGTGYLVRADRVLTCHHVVAASLTETVRVRFPHGEYAARVGAVDADSDCAVLHLEQPVRDVAPLPLAAETKLTGTAWASYGFPTATVQSGLRIDGHIQDASGEDLNRRPALVLYSRNITAGAELHGFSGSPVVANGQVIGQLRQIVPDANDGAQFGIVYACPACVLVGLLPPASGSAQHPKPLPSLPQSTCDANWYQERADKEAHVAPGHTANTPDENQRVRQLLAKKITITLAGIATIVLIGLAIQKYNQHTNAADKSKGEILAAPHLPLSGQIAQPDMNPRIIPSLTNGSTINRGSITSQDNSPVYIKSSPGGSVVNEGNITTGNGSAVHIGGTK